MPYNKKGLLERYQHVPLAPGKSVAAVASKALYVASKVAKALNVEKKFHDSYTGCNMATAKIFPLNVIPQGDTGQSRDGDQVKMTFINGRVTISNETPGTQVLRLMIIHDKQADGSVPGLSEILQLDGGAIVGPHALNNLDNKMRFYTLYDKTLVIPGYVTETGASGLNTGALYKRQLKVALNLFKKYKKGQGLRVRYNGNTGTIADIASNPVYLVLMSEANEAEIHAALNFRVRYVDN